MKKKNLSRKKEKKKGSHEKMFNLCSDEEDEN